MRTTHWVVYYFKNPNSWYPVLERARILLAIPEIQLLTHVCQWRHKAYGRWRTRCKHLSQQCVSSMSDRKQRWQELELPVVPLSERSSAGRTGQPRTLWLQGAPRKQWETRRRGRWNIGVQSPEWWRRHSIFGIGGWFLPWKRFPLWKKYSLQQQNCVWLIFSPLLWNYEIAVTFYVLGTCWNYYLFLWYWSACTYTFIHDRSLMRGVVTVTSIRYSCKTLKTKMNDIIILVERDKLMPYGVYRLQRINAG